MGPVIRYGLGGRRIIHWNVLKKVTPYSKYGPNFGTEIVAKVAYKYTINGLRLQANIASSVLTFPTPV